MAFGHRLLAWYDVMRRDLPWRQSRDPYRVWVAEVMLQQTRVDQAVDYFERFMRRFPTVSALAGADLGDVLREWEGLGYYARARHLHAAAREIVTRWDSAMPRSYEALRTLPGVGAYTARAVLSIAYGLPFAAVDANVDRILSRVFSVAEPSRGKTIQALADSVLHRERPGAFNQALMDLGATVCRPKSPDCAACPIREVCTAFAAGAPEAFPVRKPRLRTPHYDIAVGILFDHRGRLLIQQRAPEAMLGGLWEFPGGKCEKGETPEAACRREVQEETGVIVEDCELVCRVQQAYSHFRITLYAFRCARWTGTPRSHRGLPLTWVDRSELDQYAFPRANRRVLDILHNNSEEGSTGSAGVPRGNRP